MLISKVSSCATCSYDEGGYSLDHPEPPLLQHLYMGGWWGGWGARAWAGAGAVVAGGFTCRESRQETTTAGETAASTNPSMNPHLGMENNRGS